MNHFDFYWIDRFFEIFAFLILAGVAFHRRRPIFFFITILLNFLPDLWMLPSSQRIHWVNPVDAPTQESTRWITQIHDHPPQSIIATALHTILQKKLPRIRTEQENHDENPDPFNVTAFCVRLLFLILVLLLFLIDHVHGVAGLGAFLFPTFYTLQRVFQGIDLILPFQFERQLSLLRQNPADYAAHIGSNPSGLWMFVLALSLVSVGNLIFYYFTRKQARVYNIHVPNPENFQVILNDKRYDYEITRNGILIQSLEFPFSHAFSNQASRQELHFISGTVLKFVKREA